MIATAVIFAVALGFGAPYIWHRLRGNDVTATIVSCVPRVSALFTPFFLDFYVTVELHNRTGGTRTVAATDTRGHSLSDDETEEGHHLWTTTLRPHETRTAKYVITGTNEPHGPGCKDQKVKLVPSRPRPPT